ncbi:MULTISPECIES: helix-turn-helix transcriptional regulator [Streptomyces]|uniref:helix-turn-helix domain-containing protein n=1 Tax=Streptomyces TaxID=1883 RepID=UPI0005B82AB9|nr:MULTISPECIES: helix-turn-helix transcriptional regulator [Streptomyces]MDP9949158.1 transcriptional regulator with XRE-family HTH domain [Streptomyces sp. DSM 41269]
MNTAHALRLVQLRAAISCGETRQLRVAARLSISEMAAACGVDQSTLWRWEQGKRLPRGERAFRYADVIDSLRDQVDDEGQERVIA